MRMTMEVVCVLVAMFVVMARPTMDPEALYKYVMEFQSQRLPGDCMDYICRLEDREDLALGLAPVPVRNVLQLQSLSEKFLITIPLCVKNNKLPSGVELKIKAMQFASNASTSGGTTKRDVRDGEGDDDLGQFLGEKNLIIEQDTDELWNIFHERQPAGDFEEYKLLLTIQTDVFGTEVDTATVEAVTEDDTGDFFCEMANSVRVKRADD